MRNIVLSALACIVSVQASELAVKRLGPAPSKIEKFGEIATQYNCKLPELWNSLKPEERVFAYYMTQASIPGNRIFADQLHRDAVQITDLFERLVTHKNDIKGQCTKEFDCDAFNNEAEQFYVYLSAHHSQYFTREFEDHKRTPERLNLSSLTPGNIIKALKTIGLADAEKIVERLKHSIFSKDVEPTVTVDGSIEKSACNMYSPDFTKDDFESLSPTDRSALNAYFYTETNGDKHIAKVLKHKIGGHYSSELSAAYDWLLKACAHSIRYPDTFDPYVSTSLVHLLHYLKSGNEEDFKNFSIEWLKIKKSRVDFNFGFVEVYHDPMHNRGSFEADVTIKAIDMQQFNAILPALEGQLPFPPEFKRRNLDDLAAIPNASVNAKLFAVGDAGPVRRVAAYCLPNYDDIRANHGSKQIIYQQDKNLPELMNPQLARRLSFSNEHADWLDQNDPEGKLTKDLWDVQVLLHETLGHGSGKLTAHTFVEGDILTIGHNKYKVGDTIELTKENINEFIGKYSSALEELRAEIIALYTSIDNFDVLAEKGIYKDWPTKIGKEKVIEWLITRMGQGALGRLQLQKEGATEIVQAHAIANTTILNYLLDHGGLKLIEESVHVDNEKHTVVDVRVTDLSKAIHAVKDLAIQVQTIKSTADGIALTKLMEKYGTCVRHPEYIKFLKDNQKAVTGELKEIAEIYPQLTPVLDPEGKICDISAEWPEGFLEQQLELSRQSLKTT